MVNETDCNLLIAGLLQNLAAVQANKQSKWGYKRAAAAIMNLEVPIESLRLPDGTWEKVRHVGPASQRVIVEVLERGMSADEIGGQHAEIDGLNDHYEGRFRIVKGIETNIGLDGSLDVSEDDLAAIEVVMAAPHAGLRLATDQTQRMLRVVEHPRVNVLGHGRGRMFGSRPGVSADWPRVFAAAASRGVAIEIDGDPARQDVDYTLARVAVESGCLIALSSDAHASSQLRYIDNALAHARLAGVQADRVINAWTVDRLLTWSRRLGRDR